MKTDLYTKSVLTVIALCLLMLTLQQFQWIPVAYAATDERPLNTLESATHRLVPMDAFNTIDVRIVDISTYDELNVNLKSVDTYDEVKVNLKSIDTQDELDVNVDEIGGNWVSSGGPIPVRIQQ